VCGSNTVGGFAVAISSGFSDHVGEDTSVMIGVGVNRNGECRQRTCLERFEQLRLTILIGDNME